jgi:hypothetical protein
MQTWLVDLILLAVVGAVFLIALRGGKIGWGNTGFGSDDQKVTPSGTSRLLRKPRAPASLYSG